MREAQAAIASRTYRAFATHTMSGMGAVAEDETNVV